MTEKQLAEFFVEQRVLQPSQAEDVLSEVELNGKTVAQAMIDGGFIDEPSFYRNNCQRRSALNSSIWPDTRFRRRSYMSFPADWLGCTARCRLK